VHRCPWRRMRRATRLESVIHRILTYSPMTPPRRSVSGLPPVGGPGMWPVGSHAANHDGRSGVARSALPGRPLGGRCAHSARPGRHGRRPRHAPPRAHSLRLARHRRRGAAAWSTVTSGHWHLPGHCRGARPAAVMCGPLPPPVSRSWTSPPPHLLAESGSHEPPAGPGTPSLPVASTTTP
jgi:hypothetical protein